MHVITRENYEEAEKAVSDILTMYYNMASDYSGFGHLTGADVRFDPLKFLDAERESGLGGADLGLLHEGSAMAILCFFYDLWSEEQDMSWGPQVAIYEEALASGRLRRFPDIERVIRDAIGRKYSPLDEGWFDYAVEPIYEKYVLGFFKRLAEAKRSA